LIVTGSGGAVGDAAVDGEAAAGGLDGVGDAPPAQAEIMSAAAVIAASSRFIVSSSRRDRKATVNSLAWRDFR
jgi:hypothetical protein